MDGRRHSPRLFMVVPYLRLSKVWGDLRRVGESWRGSDVNREGVALDVTVAGVFTPIPCCSAAINLLIGGSRGTREARLGTPDASGDQQYRGKLEKDIALHTDNIQLWGPNRAGYTPVVQKYFFLNTCDTK
ncbi:hypothetical protein M569_10723 [Genlisea aurea]|uniref:Uncharacterized protein n=1 Tax=Genlisea aurea TaxID=192259 RepID=S8DM44_9LAMI|nr:hypothetical protein M569_10723 [Genlisea aurea]